MYWPLAEVQERLQVKAPFQPEFLRWVTIRNIRGIKDLSLCFNYPVSVLAGEKGIGKSTVLAALACAYKDPEPWRRSHTPGRMLPDLRPRWASHASPHQPGATMDYVYVAAGKSVRMSWRRTKAWRRSFFGEPGCKQPCRPLYLLHAQDGNSRPAPAPSHLTLPRRHSMQFEPVSSSLVYLAEQLLPIRFRRLFRLKSQWRRAELFAEAATGNGTGASNSARLYMPVRERAALELFASLSSLQGALALLDDVGMGLHPHRQLKLMAALQELALRNDLQIVATTRNPTLLDCVPISGRRLLERKDNKVSLRPLHHGFMASEDSSQPG